MLETPIICSKEIREKPFGEIGSLEKGPAFI